VTAPTTLHLIRHASYGLLGHTLAGRSPGHRLSQDGQREAAAIADDLAIRPLAAVIAGPLERAQETAAPIATRHRLTVASDPGFDEIAFGEWTGCRFDDLAGLPEWQAFNRLRSVAAVPGGESMLAAQARAVAALMRLRAAWPGAEIAVVSHADVLKSVLASLLGMSLDLCRRLEIAPASRSVVVLHDHDAQVLGIGLPPSGQQGPSSGQQGPPSGQ